ncbi:unnamed protein product [Lota lota]
MCPPNDKSSIIVLLQLSETQQEPGSGWRSEAGSANTRQPADSSCRAAHGKRPPRAASRVALKLHKEALICHAAGGG